MSSNRDRQLAQQRRDKRLARQASRHARIRRNQLVLGAAIAVLLVIGGAAFLTQRLGADDKADSTRPSATAANPNTTPCSTTTPAPGQPAAKTYPCPRPGLAQDSIWTAKVTTSAGNLVLELNGKAAPQTVASFISLSRNTYYDNTRCHRLTTEGIFVLQCGDPTATGSGGPGYEYDIENAPPAQGTGESAYGVYPAGTLAMARATDPHSNGSQFFMVYQDTQLPATGGGYTVFGRVTSGLDVLQAIAKKGTISATNPAPRQPVTIKSITVEKQ